MRPRQDLWRGAVALALCAGLVAATVAGLPDWTVPLRVAGWTALFALVVRITHPGRGYFAVVKNKASFDRDATRGEHAFAAFLIAGVVVMIAFAIIAKYV
jgi:hypothetical protein